MSNTSSSAVVSVNRALCCEIFKVRYASGKTYRFVHSALNRDGAIILEQAIVIGPRGKVKELSTKTATRAYALYREWAACPYDVAAAYFAKAGIISIESRIFYDDADAAAKGLNCRTAVARWGASGRVSFESYNFYKYH